MAEYNFRTTTKVSATQYLEDAGYPRYVSKGEPDWAVLDAQFGTMLKAGQTAERNGEGVWVVLDGCPVLENLRARQATEIRTQRDALLGKTDYLVGNDYPISEKKLVAVKAYRQALRDITAQPGFPEAVEWPVFPAV